MGADISAYIIRKKEITKEEGLRLFENENIIIYADCDYMLDNVLKLDNGLYVYELSLRKTFMSDVLHGTNILANSLILEYNDESSGDVAISLISDSYKYVDIGWIDKYLIEVELLKQINRICDKQNLISSEELMLCWNTIFK